MRKWICVPTIILCLLLVSCSKDGQVGFPEIQYRYQNMSGCKMEAVVICEQEHLEWEAQLVYEYFPGGESSVEVVAPETIAGIKAVFLDEQCYIEYEDLCLNIGKLSVEEISPVLCMPYMIEALRDGWLLEENAETWGEIPCLRVTLDQTGTNGNKIVSTIWLKQEDGTPLRGELSVDGENILRAEFTDFCFYDTIS